MTCAHSLRLEAGSHHSSSRRLEGEWLEGGWAMLGHWRRSRRRPRRCLNPWSLATVLAGGSGGRAFASKFNFIFVFFEITERRIERWDLLLIDLISDFA